MIQHRHRTYILRTLLLCVWLACVMSAYWYMNAHELSVRAMPRHLLRLVYDAGAFGPLVIILGYLAVTVVPFPTPALALISGAAYGPLWGSVLALLGANLGASVSFWFGRFFGRHFVSDHEKGWMKKYDEGLRENGFMAIIVLRLVGVPFDVVSIGSGLTEISYRQYLLGTFFGLLPHVVTFVVLGESFTNPKTWVLFGAMLLITILAVVLIRRSAWAKKHLLKKAPLSMYDKDV